MEAKDNNIEEVSSTVIKAKILSGSYSLGVCFFRSANFCLPLKNIRGSVLGFYYSNIHVVIIKLKLFL
jgi:hypothetical protein